MHGYMFLIFLPLHSQCHLHLPQDLLHPLLPPPLHLLLAPFSVSQLPHELSFLPHLAIIENFLKRYKLICAHLFFHFLFSIYSNRERFLSKLACKIFIVRDKHIVENGTRFNLKTIKNNNMVSL